MVAILVPLGAFIAVSFCFWALFNFRHKDKGRVQDTLVRAIDAGQQLTPDIIKALGVQAISPSFADLRRAVLLVVLGIAVVIFAFAIPDDEARRVISGLASFPIVLGLGYYVVYRIGLKENDK